MREQIAACLRDAYGLRAARVLLLPLGADPDTLVHRAVAEDGTSYFAKLRRGAFDASSVDVPAWLAEQGIAEMLAPLATRSGERWARVGAMTLIVYPFVEGRSGLDVPFSAQLWQVLGAALRRIHDAVLPAAIREKLSRETYTPRWRERAKDFIAHAADPELAAFLKVRRDALVEVVDRADRLAAALRERAPALVPCHADLHAANLLIDGDARLSIIDWDTLILAPRERDLMFVGGAQGYVGHSAEQEEALFYRGYGAMHPDPAVLSYYRYERIVQDVATYCEEISAPGCTSQARGEAIRRLNANFVPDGTIAMARRQDPG